MWDRNQLWQSTGHVLVLIVNNCNCQQVRCLRRVRVQEFDIVVLLVLQPTLLADLVLGRDVFEPCHVSPEGFLAGDSLVGTLHSPTDELGAVQRFDLPRDVRLTLPLKAVHEKLGDFDYIARVVAPRVLSATFCVSLNVFNGFDVREAWGGSQEISDIVFLEDSRHLRQ